MELSLGHPAGAALQVLLLLLQQVPQDACFAEASAGVASVAGGGGLAGGEGERIDCTAPPRPEPRHNGTVRPAPGAPSCDGLSSGLQPGLPGRLGPGSKIGALERSFLVYPEVQPSPNPSRGALGSLHSPNLPYSKGIGSLAAAIHFLKVV